METEFEQFDWEDGESIAREIFDVWSGGSDLAWAEYAWSALARSGLTRYVTEVERSVCVVRLLALGALYREFCVRAFEEGAPGEWTYKLTEDLLGEYPFLDVFSLGQLAESRGIDADHPPYAPEGVLSEVLHGLVVQEWKNVIQALRE